MTESTVSKWTSSGIFSQDSICGSSMTKSKFIVEIRRDTREFHRKDYVYVDVQRHLLDQETKKKNASQMLNSFLYWQEDMEQDNGHFSVLVERKSGILSVKIVCKVNGTKWQKR